MGDSWNVFGWFGMLIPLLFWVGLLALIVWAVIRLSQRQSREGDPPPEERSPEKILSERFARGEIDAEEYERSLQVLRRGRGERVLRERE